MPGCVFHTSGINFDADEFLSTSNFAPYRMHRKGEFNRKGKAYANSGFSLDVSESSNLQAEISDAITFLDQNESELKRLQSFPGVENMRFDFGHYQRAVIAQFDYFPPSLISRAGRLGIGIEISLYPRPQDSDSVA